MVIVKKTWQRSFAVGCRLTLCCHIYWRFHWQLEHLWGSRHKEWRKIVKKSRRQRIRQALAQERHEHEERERLVRERSPSYRLWLEEQQKAEEFQLLEEQRLACEAEEKWLKAEEEAQIKWQALQVKLKVAREERAKQTARIKAEWEQEQQKLRDIKERNEKEAEDRRKQQEELQQQILDFIENDGNVPEGMKTTFETNPNKPVCPFFQKTGGCRFKDACSRNHIRPGISRVLLLPNFYSHYSLSQTESEYGNDFNLEFESRETYDHFKEFFYDVMSEMEKFGCIRQFKVCCNREVHLRGNVYVEYSTYREAVKSYQTFYGRWYGGRQLHLEFCNIESWKSAICGLFAKQKCPKGSSCNFLHVFKNPQNLFCNADQDLHRTPPKQHENEEYDARNWRWSESPERDLNYSSNYKRKSKRSRSRSTDSRRSRKSSRSERNGSTRSKRSRSKSTERHKHSKHKRSDRSKSKDRHNSSRKYK